MATHIETLDHVVHRPTGRPVVRLFRAALNRFLLLPLGALIALVWANTDPETYYRVTHQLAFPVNEIAMAFFLALIAQELYESMMAGGALHEWKHRALPMLGAVGGLAGSLGAYALYVTLANEQVLMPAWPVVIAVDIAAGYYVLRLIYPRWSSAVSFLLLLAVITDIVALAVISIQTPGFELHPMGASLMALAFFSAVMLRRRGVKSFWPYWVISGTLSWLSLYWMGIHPALAMVPFVPMLPHDRRPGDVFADRVDHNPVHVAEHEWNAVAQIAVFLFGIVNAGVILRQFDTGTWAVLVAAVIGRPLGIMLAIALAVNVGLHLPRKMHWSDLTVAALATTSGFTFALFLGTATLPIGGVSDQVTLGALLTVAGAPVTIWMAWMLCVGRFKPRA